MSTRIPEYIDPIFLAEKQRDYEGEMLLSKLLRLGDRILNKNDNVSFQLYFSKIGKLAVIKGNIRAKLELECQSCLGAVVIEVSSDVKLVIVQSDEEAALIPDEYEALLCDQETITFAKIIEDEILLALPAIAKHDNDCFEAQESEVTIENKDESVKDSPFSVLATLKNLEQK